MKTVAAYLNTRDYNWIVFFYKYVLCLGFFSVKDHLLKILGSLNTYFVHVHQHVSGKFLAINTLCASLCRIVGVLGIGDMNNISKLTSFNH